MEFGMENKHMKEYFKMKYKQYKQTAEYYCRILPEHYMTPRRFMNIMQRHVAYKDAKDIGGMVGYMLNQPTQPEYIPSSCVETLWTYNLAKIEARKTAFNSDANTDGFIAEFGVNKGTGFIPLCGLTDQTVHGFDGFDGLENGGKWGGNMGHQDMFKNNGKVTFKMPRNGKIKIGWFEDTVPGYDFGYEQAKFINLDSDTYSSYKTVLDNIGKYIKKGTVIALDDYFNSYNFRLDSAFTAWQEFVKENNIKYKYIYCVAPAVIVKIL